MKISKHLFTKALMIIFAVGVFVYIGVETNWVETWKAVKSANYFYILLAVILMTTAHYLRGARWDQLSRAAGYPINHRRAFYSVMSGYLVNVATSRGGEVVRCALTAKSEKAPVETLVGTVITERIIDLVIMLFMAALALMLQFDVLYQFAEPYVIKPLFNNGAYILLALIIAATALYFWRKFTAKKDKKEGGIIQKLLHGINSAFELENKVKFITYSFAIWFAYWVSLYFQLQALEMTQHLTLFNALAILIFSSLGVIIPLPGGAGVWYAIAYGLTLVYGLPQESAKTFGIFTVAFSNIFHLLLGGISYGLLFFEMQSNEKSESSI
ncbi:MAG: flippase-like domain-containing protein [Bacteroidia bacterium]|nr:flippase-like domain-containing protein [Bacteroidia bacterium]